jgi:hypothetical protein
MPLDWTAQGGTLQLRFVLIDCSTRVFRRKAEAALGPRFDVRRFHDAVLGSGPCRCLCWIRSLPTSSPLKRNGVRIVADVLAKRAALDEALHITKQRGKIRSRPAR